MIRRTLPDPVPSPPDSLGGLPPYPGVGGHALAPSPEPAPTWLLRPAGGALDDAVELVETRHAGPHAFLLKARASGRFYQVAPARDPRQPRFWCVVVYRCSREGLADTAERPWVGPGGISRDDLSGVMAEIKGDLGAWLAGESCRELRHWLLAVGADSPATEG